VKIVSSYNPLYNDFAPEKNYKDLVTVGDDPKIAYQEKEINALMEEKRILNELLTKQDHMIEELVRRLKELTP